MSPNPYRDLVDTYARLAQDGKAYPLGAFPPRPKPALPSTAPKALLFSPHPDDEVIIGALPLRLLRESGMNVINVAVTLGSKKERQAGRLAELRACCDCIGFNLIQTTPNGLEKIHPNSRTALPDLWRSSTQIIADLLRREQPHSIFFPHDQDWNSTHEGTHLLILDALRTLGPNFKTYLVETEFWGQMDDPNLMVESTPEQVADLITALTFHVEEVRRNPYHLLVPAWMQDNVRRGCELVGGQGGAAPNFTFATLYRLRHWNGEAAIPLYPGGKYLPATTPASSLFATE